MHLVQGKVNNLFIQQITYQYIAIIITFSELRSKQCDPHSSKQYHHLDSLQHHGGIMISPSHSVSNSLSETNISPNTSATSLYHSNDSHHVSEPSSKRARRLNLTNGSNEQDTGGACHYYTDNQHHQQSSWTGNSDINASDPCMNSPHIISTIKIKTESGQCQDPSASPDSPQNSHHQRSPQTRATHQSDQHSQVHHSSHHQTKNTREGNYYPISRMHHVGGLLCEF